MPPLLKPSAGTFEKNFPPLLTPLYNTQVGAWQVVSDGEYSCGSSGESDIPLKFPDVAPEHCRFVFEKHAFYLLRLKGRVWVNEIPVVSEVSLRQGDVICLGAVSFRLDAADPLVRPLSGSALRPRILGHIDASNVQYVGHTDQRFTDAFPRRALPKHQRPDADSLELQEQRELILQRESEVRSREEAVQTTELQIRQFLQELEAMRSELSTEQWQLKKNRQSLASDREQLQQQLQQLRLDQETLESRRQQLIQATQSDTAQSLHFEEQLRAREHSFVQLEETFRTSERRSEQLSAQLQQATEELEERALATEELRKEVLLLRAADHAESTVQNETEYRLATGLTQLERDRSAIGELRNSLEQIRRELDAREDSLRIQQNSLEKQEQWLQQQLSETLSVQQANVALRDELQREKKLVADQQQEFLARELAVQQQALAIEQQTARLCSSRQELESLSLTVDRERSESQVIAERLSLREKEMFDQQCALVDLQQQLYAEREHLLQQAHAATERETRLHLQEQSIAVREAQRELQGDSQPPAEHLQQLQLREQMLISREAELIALEQQYQEKLLALQNGELKLLQHREQCEDRWNQLTAEECAVQARASEIGERLALWSTERRNRNAQLAAREQHLAQQLRDIQAGNAALKVSQKELAAQQQRLATASEQLDIRRQLLQEQHVDLAAERDNAIAELTSSRVMIVELRHALEQARSANARSAELKAKLAEQDAMLNHLAESEAAARDALLKSQEDVKRLKLVAAEASHAYVPEETALQSVIVERDSVISELKRELLQSQQGMHQTVESLRRASQLQVEHQVTQQRQIHDAEKGLEERDTLIRELRNHLAKISGRNAFAEKPPELPTEVAEPLDPDADDVIRNLQVSDFFINLDAAEKNSVTSSHSEVYSSESAQHDELLGIDVGYPDEDQSASNEVANFEHLRQASSAFEDGREHGLKKTSEDSRLVPGSRKADLQIPGALSAELISLLEMDFQSDRLKSQEEDTAGHTPAAPENFPSTGSAGHSVTTAESPGQEHPRASMDSTAETLERQVADSEVQQYMDQLLSSLRNSPSQHSDPEDEKKSRNTGFKTEVSQKKSAEAETESVGGYSGYSGKKLPVSFIEKYRSGELSFEPEPPTSSSMPTPQPGYSPDVESVPFGPAITLYRPKTNFVKIRSDMNNIRVLSTQLAEQAIVSHSLKRQQSGLLPRSAAVVVCLAIIVWLKPFLLVWISVPEYVDWGTLGLLLLSCLELLRKLILVSLVRFERFSGSVKSRRTVNPSEKPHDQNEGQRGLVSDNGDAPLF